LALGVTLGALIFRKLSRAAQKLTPQGIAGGLSQSLSDLAHAVGDFAADVREATSSRESDLREAAGLDSGGPDSDGPDSDRPDAAPKEKRHAIR
jgi:hypothetical protein